MKIIFPNSLFLTLILLGCQSNVPRFDEDHAFSYLVAQCDFGPRNPGSDGYYACLDYLITELDQSTNEINQNKKLLADEATKLCHNKIEKDICVLKKKYIKNGLEAFEIVSINKKIINSKSDARRLIRGGAVKFNGKLIKDELEKISEKNLSNNKIEVSIGKKNHFTIHIV